MTAVYHDPRQGNGAIGWDSTSCLLQSMTPYISSHAYNTRCCVYAMQLAQKSVSCQIPAQRTRWRRTAGRGEEVGCMSCLQEDVRIFPSYVRGSTSTE